MLDEHGVNGSNLFLGRTKAKHMNAPSENSCPVCASRHLKVFFEMLDVPVHCNLLWESQDAARYCPKGDIRLAFCPVCGFITNLAFDPTPLEYTQAYDNSLYFSPRFHDYAQSQAERLIECYDLYNKDIIEIGCGQGDFLLMLCELGNNRGVGFDPAYVKREKRDSVEDQVKFIQDFYSDRYKNYKADLIVCRHVLEHIQDPKSFLNTIRQAMGHHLHTYVFFEVPNALHTFQRLFVWDIIYEHCSYFTPISLSRTFSSCGFHVCEVTEEYEGQYLCIDAMPSKQSALDSGHVQHYEVNQISRDIESFASTHRKKVEKCRRKIEQIEGMGQRAVIWGAGSKGVTFLNTFKNTRIKYAVDINPRKQGMYIPGTGQRIVPPEFLRDYQPDVVIVMNPIYQSEIKELTKRLGITPNFISV